MRPCGLHPLPRPRQPGVKNGEFDPGDPLTEVAIARKMGASVDTPWRMNGYIVGVVAKTPEEKDAAWRAAAKVAFCAALAETCSVTRACEAVAISRVTAYNWQEADPEFATAWEKAAAWGAKKLIDEAVRRGMEGYEEPVFYEGAQVATVRKYSDSLLGRLLSAHHPAFRTTDITSGGKSLAPTDPSTLATEMAKLIATLRERKAEDEV